MKQRIIIIGANSDIGMACATEFLNLGHAVTLAGHQPEKFPENPAFKHLFLDVTQFDPRSLNFLDYDYVLYIAGKLKTDETELVSEENTAVLDVNFTSAVTLLTHVANQFKERKSGTIVGISSVAALRGKQSTIIYSAAKAGFDTFLSGLRNHLFLYNVRVLTIRPGFVATKMTQHLHLPKLLTATKTSVAHTIVKHTLHGKRSIVYTKPIWRPVMYIIRRIPEFIFKRLKL